MLDLRTATTWVLFATSAALAPPTIAYARTFVSWFVRPATLPFAWQALVSATEGGQAREAFARGQQIMALLPSWTDGHAAFAFRFALTAERPQDGEAEAASAARRLDVALVWLEQARAYAGRRELELLQMASLLPEVACRQFPGLNDLLRDRGGAAGIADDYLREAERLFPSAAVREQRLWHTPTLAAALLANGNAGQALAVLDAAVERAPSVRDRQLATEWRQRVIEVTRRLRGDLELDLAAVFADRRFEPLWPYLR